MKFTVAILVVVMAAFAQTVTSLNQCNGGCKIEADCGFVDGCHCDASKQVSIVPFLIGLTSTYTPQACVRSSDPSEI